MASVFTAQYSESLVRAAVTRFWLRSLGLRFGVTFFALGLLLAYRLQAGDRSWWVVLLGVVVAISLVMGVAAWAAQMQRALEVLRDLDNGQATFTVAEDRLIVRSRRATTELPWGAIRQVWRYPDLWLLVYSPHSFSTLPLGGVPPEALAEIEQRVRKARGRLG